MVHATDIYMIMKIVTLLILLLIFNSCTNTISKNKIEENDKKEPTSLITEMNVSSSRVTMSGESVSISEKIIDLGDLFGEFRRKNDRPTGHLVKTDNLIPLKYSFALVASDTLIFVTDENKMLPYLNFKEIRKNSTEAQLKKQLKGYHLLKTTENCENPYLFFVNRDDSIQYMRNPLDKENHSYEFCEARLGKNVHNEFTKSVFGAFSKLNLENLSCKYPQFKFIWFIQVDDANALSSEKSGHEWSFFVTLSNSKIERVLLTIDYDAVLGNNHMSDYLVDI